MKIVFLGFGSIGRRNFNACKRARPEYSYGVYRPMRAERDLNRVPIPEGVIVVRTAEELAAWEPDLGYICTPNDVHFRSLDALTGVSCGVFMEKPLAASLADLRRIEAWFQGRSNRFFYGCILRHHPLILQVLHWIKGGMLGRPLEYRIICKSWLPDWRPTTDYRLSYSAQEAGGVTLDLIHEFDYSEFLFGPIISLQGVKENLGILGIKSDERCVASARHQADVKGVFELDYITRERSRRVEVLFEMGHLVADLVTGSLAIESNGNKQLFVHSISRDALHDIQAKSVFEVIENRVESPWRLHEAIRLNQMLLQKIRWK